MIAKCDKVYNILNKRWVSNFKTTKIFWYVHGFLIRIWTAMGQNNKFKTGFFKARIYKLCFRRIPMFLWSNERWGGMFDLDFIDIRFRTCLFQLMFNQNALFLERKKIYLNRQFFIGYPDQSKLLTSWLILTGLPHSTPQKQSILYDSTPAILVKINQKCPL